MKEPARSAWTHAICDLCWVDIRPSFKEPIRMTEPKREICCACAQYTTSGIYYKSDPRQMECLGDHTNDPSASG